MKVDLQMHHASVQKRADQKRDAQSGAPLFSEKIRDMNTIAQEKKEPVQDAHPAAQKEPVQDAHAAAQKEPIQGAHAAVQKKTGQKHEVQSRSSLFSKNIRSNRFGTGTESKAVKQNEPPVMKNRSEMMNGFYYEGKQYGTTVKKLDIEEEKVSKLLLSVSDQAVLAEQLKDKGVLAEFIGMLQQLAQMFGSAELGQLPLEQRQAIQAFLQQHGIGKEWEAMPVQQLLNHLLVAKERGGVIAERIDLADTGLDVQNTGLDVQDTDIGPVESFSAMIETEANTVSGVLKPEKASISDMANIIQGKMEDVQKFLVKNERIWLQLNPEKFGDVQLYMKKDHDHIRIHVECDHRDVKEKLELLFDDIRLRLKERDIQVELSYTERDGKKDQKEEQRHNGKQHVISEEEKEQEHRLFEGLLEGSQ